MSVFLLLVAAGSGTRMGLGHNKALMPLGGKPMLLHCVEAFSGLVDGMVIVTRQEDLSAVRALLPEWALVVTGGATRQASVLAGLRALPEQALIALVHDAARPFVTRDIILRCIDSVKTHGSAVACVPVKDTIKQAGPGNLIRSTLPRETLYAAQTPQAFSAPALRKAIEALEAQGETATDDASVMERAGLPVHFVLGSYRNIKVTTPEDIALAEWMIMQMHSEIRIGHGMDAHRLVEGRPLVLCGLTIPFEKGLLGHSDADVALHALMDAMLGAAALGDIGRHFPDTDERYRGISSLLLLRQVNALLEEQGYRPHNVDLTIIAQRPKLRDYLPDMARQVAGALAIEERRVNVKATTTEGMGFEGEGLGISAHAVVTLGARA